VRACGLRPDWEGRDFLEIVEPAWQGVEFLNEASVMGRQRISTGECRAHAWSGDVFEDAKVKMGKIGVIFACLYVYNDHIV
jgi:hypothetical protein